MNFYIETGLSVFLLILGFALLVKGADWFVDGASGIAKKLGVSQLVIALTIVAMGTSIPETSVSLLAVLRGSGDLAVGNIVGTNTLNILLILGLTALIRPVFVHWTTVWFEIPMVIGTAVVFCLVGLGGTLLLPGKSVDGTISRWEGVLLLALFAFYLVYLGWLAKKSKSENCEITQHPVPVEHFVPWLSLIAVVVLGLGFVIGGSSLVVRSAVDIATALGISERFIGLTVVALGTSLPELATSITAAVKKQDDLAVGNIVGSNIYNMLFIGGVTALIKPVPYNASFVYDSLICIGTSFLLWFCVMTDKWKRLNRRSAVVMLGSYAGYFAWLVIK